MINVKQLYVLWTSDEGDKKLIPKEEYQQFKEDLHQAEWLFENVVLYTAAKINVKIVVMSYNKTSIT